MKSKAIIIVPYSDEWTTIFKQIKSVLSGQLKDLIEGIEHVGSTAVPGLAAKPIIDIDIIIRNKNNFDPISDILKRLNYTCKGDLGIPGRYFFERNTNTAPLVNPEIHWHEHHLYVCLQDSISLKNHLLFRDFLRSNPAIAKQYGALKAKLALQYIFDIDAYVAAKTAFIIFALEKAGMAPQALPAIIDQNKNKCEE